jgi:hypothetical protein
MDPIERERSRKLLPLAPEEVRMPLCSRRQTWTSSRRCRTRRSIGSRIPVPSTLRKLTKMRLLLYVHNVDFGHKILNYIKPAKPLAITTSKQEPPPSNSVDLSVILCRTIISPLRRTSFDYIYSYLEETMNTGQIRQVERMMRRWLRQWNQVKRLGQCFQRTVQNHNREAPAQASS